MTRAARWDMRLWWDADGRIWLAVCGAVGPEMWAFRRLRLPAWVEEAARRELGGSPGLYPVSASPSAASFLESNPHLVHHFTLPTGAGP